MLFRTFYSQEERRNSGGSGFLEMQFCKMKPETEIKKLVSVSSINHWKDESLYIHLDDIDDFVKEYSDIFNCGIYSNLETGAVDIHGVNYYKPDVLETIIVDIFEKKPEDYESLIEWLYKAQYYNGFYILGI